MVFNFQSNRPSQGSRDRAATEWIVSNEGATSHKQGFDGADWLGVGRFEDHVLEFHWFNQGINRSLHFISIRSLGSVYLILREAKGGGEYQVEIP